MWRKSFVATSVALGLGVDDALEPLEPLGPLEPSRREPGAAGLDDAGVLVTKLRAEGRAARATALAAAVHEIIVAIDEAGLR